MSIQADYSRDEWDLIIGAPALSALVIIHAERGGPWVTHRQLLAVSAAIDEMAAQPAPSELVQAVIGAVQAGQSPLWPTHYPGDLEPTHRWALATCHRLAALLAQKTPEAEAAAYTSWLLSIGRRVAMVSADEAHAGAHAIDSDALRRGALELLAIALDAPPAADELPAGSPG